MNKSSSKISELEGMIMCEIDRQGKASAYSIQKAFVLSPSSFWAASKGAIYPAIDRLVRAKLLKAAALKSDKRGTRHLTLTRKGEAALNAWASDIETAVSPGADPFRSRAAYWTRHSEERSAAFDELLKQDIHARIEVLKKLANEAEDAGFRSQIKLEIELQRSRLSFLGKMT